MKILNAWICQIKDEEVHPIFGDLSIDNGKITAIEEKKFNNVFPNEDGREILDAKGVVLTVPNVNFHDHIYSRLAKGLNIEGDMSDFPNILKNLWWKLDGILDHDMIRASTQMAALESIKTGVTYLIDHHSSPNSALDSLKTIADELENFNLRSVLCFETTDRNGDLLKNKGIEENLNFLKNYSNENSKSLMGLHASFTLQEKTLNEVKDLVEKYNWGVHVHLCEDISDPEISIQKYSAKPVERFVKFNLLNEKSIVAHGIHLENDDFELLKNSGAAIAFNLDSNMNNSVGLQKYKMIPTHIPILIGTDGMHSNIGRSFKELFLQLRHAGFSFDEAFEFIKKSFFDQQKFIKRYFDDFTTLQIDDRADFIIWDYAPPSLFHSDNFWGHFIYGILERQVRHVFQNGKILLEDFQLSDVDESAINEQIYPQGKRLSEEFNREK